MSFLAGIVLMVGEVDTNHLVSAGPSPVHSRPSPAYSRSEWTRVAHCSQRGRLLGFVLLLKFLS
jgi:hypothetical protein